MTCMALIAFVISLALGSSATPGTDGEAGANAIRAIAIAIGIVGLAMVAFALLRKPQQH